MVTWTTMDQIETDGVKYAEKAVGTHGMPVSLA